MASVAALDITAQVPANNDDFNSDVDETGINAAISDDDEVTAKFRAKRGQ